MSIFDRFRRAAPGGPPAAPPMIAAGAEPDWHDCTFAPRQLATYDGGVRVLRVAAEHRGAPVGFDVVLGGEWPRVDFGPDVPFTGHRGLVELRSSGPDSDRFVRALGALYGVAAPPDRMAESVAFTGLTLEGDPAELLSQAVRIKLFFEHDGEDRYAEAHLNVDLPSRMVQLNEKDPDYRAPLLRALAGA